MKNRTCAIRARGACAAIFLALLGWSGVSPSLVWAHPPVVNLTSPASGATVSGVITVSADASSEIGVAAVQFFVDGAVLGAEDTGAPFSIDWDTAVANGAHSLTAVARDKSHNTTTSAAVTVTVSNATAPPPGTVTRVEQTDPAVTYSGSFWFHDRSDRPFSGGTASFVRVQEPVFTSAVLASGTHTLVIEATGTANPSATDTLVVVDAFDVAS